MDKLRLIEVPNNSTGHFINNVGCLRYSTTIDNYSVSRCIELDDVYLENSLHEIVGYTEVDSKKYIVIRNKQPKQKCNIFQKIFCQ